MPDWLLPPASSPSPPVLFSVCSLLSFEAKRSSPLTPSARTRPPRFPRHIASRSRCQDPVRPAVVSLPVPGECRLWRLEGDMAPRQELPLNRRSLGHPGRLGPAAPQAARACAAGPRGQAAVCVRLRPTRQGPAEAGPRVLGGQDSPQGLSLRPHPAPRPSPLAWSSPSGSSPPWPLGGCLGELGGPPPARRATLAMALTWPHLLPGSSRCRETKRLQIPPHPKSQRQWTDPRRPPWPGPRLRSGMAGDRGWPFYPPTPWGKCRTGRARLEGPRPPAPCLPHCTPGPHTH